MMDLSKIHNPYDFANPISEEALFIGRQKEKEEINYYLDHAKTAPRPINIALLGSRASGKTSMLNITDIGAKARGFCTVRINLDEGDANTQLGFFFKLFDGIFTEACKSGAFGGLGSITYDRYLDIVYTYKIPEEKTFCPFLFPLQYAKAMASGNVDAPLSDNSFKSDLAKIYEVVSCPILILFDECNILANSRIHLEKLRNIFMNTPGFMLIITGTPDLFPVIDEIFSPIVRQFKKIELKGFEDQQETEDCIRKPLKKIGIVPEEIFDFETYNDVWEIHDLSGGRPYEIQLICHMLFKRVQSKRAKKMKLDLSVLEDVRKELETTQDIITRPILLKIRKLNEKQLWALNLLCACDGLATLDQIWKIEYIFAGKKKWTKETLTKESEFLMKEGILESKKGILKFAGDYFDKIYTKYFAREQRVPLVFPDFCLEIFFSIRLKKIIKTLKGQSVLVSDTNFDLFKIAKDMASEKTDKDIFVESPPMIKFLYHLMLDYRNKEIIPIVQTRIILPWLKAIYWFYPENQNDTKLIEDCFHLIGTLSKRATKVGGELIVEKKELVIAPIELLAKKIETTANEKLRYSLAREHDFIMCKKYLAGNAEEALFYANLSYRYNPSPDADSSNNLGYLFMALDELDKARILLNRSLDLYEEPQALALPNYNLGVLEAKCGLFDNALPKINLAIEQIKNTSKEKREMACLFIPKIINGVLKFEQIENPDLLEVAQKAKDTLTLLSQK